MFITEDMRLERALRYLLEERNREKESIERITNIHITEVIIIRNKKQMYLAEVEQAIRNINEKRALLAEASA